MLEDEMPNTSSVVWSDKALNVAISKRSIHLISLKINPGNILISLKEAKIFLIFKAHIYTLEYAKLLTGKISVPIPTDRSDHCYWHAVYVQGGVIQVIIKKIILSWITKSVGFSLELMNRSPNDNIFSPVPTSITINFQDHLFPLYL